LDGEKKSKFGTDYFLAQLPVYIWQLWEKSQNCKQEKKCEFEFNFFFVAITSLYFTILTKKVIIAEYKLENSEKKSHNCRI